MTRHSSYLDSRACSNSLNSICSAFELRALALISPLSSTLFRCKPPLRDEICPLSSSSQSHWPTLTLICACAVSRSRFFQRCSAVAFAQLISTWTFWANLASSLVVIQCLLSGPATCFSRGKNHLPLTYGEILALRDFHFCSGLASGSGLRALSGRSCSLHFCCNNFSGSTPLCWGRSSGSDFD